jgi:hypothetical protein
MHPLHGGENYTLAHEQNSKKLLGGPGCCGLTKRVARAPTLYTEELLED